MSCGQSLCAQCRRTEFKTHLDHHSYCDLGHHLTLLGLGYFLSKKRVISKPVSPPASPRVTFLPSAYTEKQGDVWVVWISPQCGVALRLELAFWTLKQGTQLNSQGHSCQRVVTRSLLSCVFTSHFIIGDSGNPLQCCWTNDPGKAEEKSCRLVCVCVFWLCLWHLSFSLHPICGPANLCSVPFMLLCPASGKVCIVASEGPRRYHRGIAHTPQPIYSEFTSLLLRGESDKIRGLKSQTSLERCTR